MLIRHPLPVKRKELEAVTEQWLKLCEIRDALKKDFERLRKLEAEVTAERRALMARLADGAELDDG